jgi:hypothetical protein
MSWVIAMSEILNDFSNVTNGEKNATPIAAPTTAPKSY